MHDALQANPLSYPLLHVQVDFLLSKGKAEWAQQVAQQAVNAAPSEFVTWAKLTETFIQLGQFDAALLTLNSCPMFTFNERDLHRMPTPARTHLPVKKFIADSNIVDEESTRDNEADVALLRLPAPGLRGTFANAYSLLAQLVAKLGWDELLKTRSQVFVMEEEYRAHKRTETIDESAPPAEIPTIRISTESARTPMGHARVPTSASVATNGTIEAIPEDEEVPAVEKPETAHAEVADGVDEETSAFSNKRLCERWLDNLFLVLYEVSLCRSR
jgi:hypothetical protein